MKITCESCGSKYQLDDSKVQGKTKKFGVKCPSCGTVIVVVPPELQGEAPAEAASPPPPPPQESPPPAESPPAAGGDPFGGIDFDNLGAGDVGGGAAEPASPPAPPAPPAPETGGGDPFDFGAAAPPAGAAEPASPPAPPAPETGGGDPFDFGAAAPPAGAAEPASPPAPPAPETGGGDPFDFGSGDAGAPQSGEAGGMGFGEVDFGGDEGGEELDDLDRMDRELDEQAAAGASATDEGFFGVDAGAASSYRLKNARGQVAGPFTTDAIREFALQGRFTGEEELSRNDGPWISAAVITELPNVGSVNLDQIMADASTAAAPEMDDAITFTDEEMAATAGAVRVKGKGRAIPKVAIFALLGVLALAVAGGGVWYWWTHLREIPLDQLTDAKIAELARGGSSAGGKRAAQSEQAFQQANAIIDRYAVEGFGDAQDLLLTAIQKNPANYAAVAELARLQAEWVETLGEADRAGRAKALADVARTAAPGLPEAQLASAAAARVGGRLDEALKFARQAIKLNPRLVSANVEVARVLLAKKEGWEGLDEALKQALALEPEDQLALLTLAKADWARERYDEALTRYDQAIASRPGNVWPRYRKAMLLYELVRYAEASEAASEASAASGIGKMRPLQTTVQVLEARIALAQRRATDAMDLLAKAERLAPGRADVGVARGDALFQMENYAESLQEYQKALRSDPNYILGYLRLGRTKLYLKDLTEAEKALRKALSLDPELTEAHLLLGKALAKQERYDEASEEFNAVIAKEPENAPAYAEKGRMLAARGLKDEAARMFLKAINLDPDNASIYLMVGGIFSELGRTDEAIDYTRRAVRLAPESIEAKVQMGQLYFKTGKYRPAITQFEAAYEAMTDSIPVLLDLAKAERAVKDFQSAKKHLLEAKKIKGSNAAVRYYLGRTHLDLGDATSASAELSRAVFYDERNPEYFYWYGRALREQNKLPEAQRQFGNAIKWREQYVAAHFALGQTLQMQGNTGNAKEEFERVLKISKRHVSAMVALGLIYKDAEQKPKKAMDLLMDALRLDSRNSQAAYGVCQIFIEARKYPEAIKYCRQAIGSNRGLCAARVDLGYAYEGSTQVKKACATWKAAAACKGIDPYLRQDVEDRLSQSCGRR